ncbi:MAG: hypothetical protein SRB2_00301 [Desulfobacteraceae bacterium Eth-SRB2]|nr:MAG: hypothetical protein SRB2_00301 [Desulfobacteraceae bacterium Eth-SRB2]
MKIPHIQLASRYFDDLAGRFPVMCASDEFHFLPRAQAASEYYDRLDDLEGSTIEECVDRLRSFKQELALLTAGEKDLETLIDLDLLTANVSGILIELEHNKSWRHNPLLYLKIAFIGIDHALNKPASHTRERIHRTLKRISAVPRLLNQAVDNIDGVPETYHQAARAMLHDGKQYLEQAVGGFCTQYPGLFSKDFQKALAALNDFDKYLEDIPPVPDRMFAMPSLESSLKDHFLSVLSLDEVFQIAVDEWWENLQQLEKIQSKIDPRKSWQDLYHDFCPDIGEIDTIALYRRETELLRRFFRNHGFREEDLCASLEITATPYYLKSVRSAASFGAALSSDAGEKSFFFITTRFPQQQSSAPENDLLRKRLHREYKFLTAHETIPGHHLLDSIRRRLENPVRRQIESPLFYEGWAYYAESLLTEQGYVQNPMEYLVDYKRRLWRSARCQIDVGLHAGFLTLADSVELLLTAGFNREEAQRQIYRFQLNPGYQLCYSLGRYEIMRLKKAYENRMGSEQFHAFLLEGGELPFHWIEKRFQALNIKE